MGCIASPRPNRIWHTRLTWWSLPCKDQNGVVYRCWLGGDQLKAIDCRHPGKVHVNGNSTGLASKNWVWTEKSTSAETLAMPVFFAWVRGQELVFLAQDAPFKCGFICSGWFHPSIFWSFATTISVLSLALFCFSWWSNKLGKTDLFRSWLGSRSQDRCFKTVTPWVREDSGGFSPRRGGWIDSFHGKRGTFLRIFSNQR